MPYETFLCYHPNDVHSAQSLCASLEAYGIRCWLATRDMPSTPDWQAALRNAIDSCQTVTLLVTPETLQSPVIAQQIAHANAHNIPVIAFRTIPGAPVTPPPKWLILRWIDGIAAPGRNPVGDLVDVLQTLPARHGHGTASLKPAPVAVPPSAGTAPPASAAGPLSSSATPFEMPAPPPASAPWAISLTGFASNTGLAQWLTMLLGVGIVLDLFGIFAYTSQWVLLGHMQAGSGFTQAASQTNDLRIAALGLAQLGLYLLTAIVFATWMYRIYRNLHAFGAQGLEYSPGWAAGGFFVPFLNLVRPYQVMQEIWKASDESVVTGDRDHWKTLSPPSLISLWWGTWIISNIVAWAGMRTPSLASHEERETLLASLQFSTMIDIFSDLLTICAAVLAILLIRKVTLRQETTYARGYGNAPTTSLSYTNLPAALVGALMVLLAGAVTLSAGAVGQLLEQKSQWSTYRAPSGSFSIEVPGTLTASQDEGVLLYSLQDGLTEYSVVDRDFGQALDRETQAQVLGEIVKDLPSRMEGQTVSDQPVTQNGVTGRELVIRTRQGTSVRIRVFVANRHLYEVILGTTEDRLHSEDAERYFRSFVWSGR